MTHSHNRPDDRTMYLRPTAQHAIPRAAATLAPTSWPGQATPRRNGNQASRPMARAPNWYNRPTPRERHVQNTEPQRHHLHNPETTRRARGSERQRRRQRVAFGSLPRRPQALCARRDSTRRPTIALRSTRRLRRACSRPHNEPPTREYSRCCFQAAAHGGRLIVSGRRVRGLNTRRSPKVFRTRLPGKARRRGSAEHGRIRTNGSGQFARSARGPCRVTRIQRLAVPHQRPVTHLRRPVAPATIPCRATFHMPRADEVIQYRSQPP
jgi:hypothetical protein